MLDHTAIPSFVCVGAQKSGTTALHHHLSRHPGIFLPHVKETHFFDDGHGEWHLGLGHYLKKYFSAVPENALAGEIDPEYLFFPEVPERLANFFPRARLIFVFREPVSRAFSHYWMTVRRGREKLSFPDALAAEPERMRGDHLSQSDFSYASRGLYATQVERYLNYFPREQMLFLLSEDLKREPESNLARVYKFLDLPSIPFQSISDEESHQAYMPISKSFQGLLDESSKIKRFGKAILPASVRRPMMNFLYRLQARNRRKFVTPPLDELVKIRLKEEFSVEVERLQHLIGRDLAAWLPGSVLTREAAG